MFNPIRFRREESPIIFTCKIHEHSITCTAEVSASWAESSPRPWGYTKNMSCVHEVIHSCAQVEVHPNREICLATDQKYSPHPTVVQCQESFISFSNQCMNPTGCRETQPPPYHKKHTHHSFFGRICGIICRRICLFRQCMVIPTFPELGLCE